MRCPTLDQLPPPPVGKVGWPWTEETTQLPEMTPDGRLWPKISIVTPSYQQGQFIEETIRSILLQGYPNLEYMVIDGGSTDDSIEIIRKYEPFLAFWVSEQDRGQSHALNKGFKRVSGEIAGWINSDDLLTQGALGYVASAWNNNPGTLIAGPVLRFESENGTETLQTQYGLTFTNLVQRWTKQCRFQQPGLFFPRLLLEQVGWIDETLRYSMDYDLFCRLLRQASVTYIDMPLARFRYHNTSKTVSQESNFAIEGLAVSQRYWGDWLSSDQRRRAYHSMAQRLTRHAMRHLVRGKLSFAGKLFGQALKYSPLATISEPFRSSILFVQRRIHF